jgi:hypothetical protein
MACLRFKVSKLNWGKQNKRTLALKRGSDNLELYNATTTSNGQINPFKHSYKKHKVVLTRGSKNKKQVVNKPKRQQPNPIAILQQAIAWNLQRRTKYLGSIKSMQDSIRQLEGQLLQLDNELTESKRKLEFLLKEQKALK